MRKIKILLCLFFLVFAFCKKEQAEPKNTLQTNNKWRFVVVGDTHVTTNSDTITEMIPYFLQDSIDLVLVCGDIIEGGKRTTMLSMKQELELFQSYFNPLYEKGIKVYPVRGNHEDDVTDDITAWNSIFTGKFALPQNGPSGELNLTYSFTHKNAFFVGLDNYVNIHKVNQDWLNTQFTANKQLHVFVFGHEAAFKVFHTDCLDDFTTERNTFWKSLANAGAKVYFCGHDHFFNATKPDDGDGNPANDVIQCVTGGGGGWLMSKYAYNGVNTPYALSQMYHDNAHGYLLVEVSGNTNSDLDVTITWKHRVENVTTKSVTYQPTDMQIRYKAQATK